MRFFCSSPFLIFCAFITSFSVASFSPAFTHAAFADQLMTQQARNFFITVDHPSADREWNAYECQFISHVLSQTWQRLAPTCARTSDLENTRLARLSGDFQYHVSVVKKEDGSILLEFHDWSIHRDWTEPRTLSWNIAAGPQTQQEEMIRELLEKTYTTVKTRRFQKEFLLRSGVQTSKSLRLDLSDGYYYRTATGERLEKFEDAYAIYQNESPKQKHYLRAGLELFGVLASGMGWYWSNQDFNSVDWELKWDWPSWRAKFQFSDKAMSFDTNTMKTNTVAHPFSGTIYYLLTRSNNLNILESVLLSVAASTTWEYMCEFREKVSINDEIVTPIAGMAIGEVLFQLGAFFNRGEDNWLNRTLATLFSSPKTLHDWLDKNRPKPAQNLDRFGFTAEGWHQFDLFAGIGGSAIVESDGLQNRRMDVDVGVETQIIHVPGYEKAGRISRILYDGNFSQLLLKGSLGTQGLLDFTFFTKAALAGYYRQNIQEVSSAQNGKSALKGYSFFIGASTAFDYNLHDQLPAGTDQVAVVNVLGSTLDMTYYHHGLKVRVVLDVYPDFAMVRSYAIDRFLESHSAEGFKGVLAEQRYYYAFGVTVSPKLVASYNGFEVGGDFKFDYFDSIEGMDRYQDRVTNDVNVIDQRMKLKAWLSYTFPHRRVKLTATFEELMREGRLLDSVDKHMERRFVSNVSLLF